MVPTAIKAPGKENNVIKETIAKIDTLRATYQRGTSHVIRCLLWISFLRVASNTAICTCDLDVFIQLGFIASWMRPSIETH